MKLIKTMIKPRIAIYDFTDCEGCEVKLISLREKLLLLEKKVDIVNWRLTREKFEQGPYDLTIIEGSPITQKEIDLLKKLRENSKTLIALGACATLGGIPAIIPEKDRKMWYEKIYTSQYCPRGVKAVPLSDYVKIDFSIHGCPVDDDEVLRVIEAILKGKTPYYRDYSVCYDCKIVENACRLLENKPCLGPITQGGCKAICVSGGSPCYGCFGIREEANMPALEKIFNPEQLLRIFHSRNNDIK
jgi:coenzyme F420-reducing hydrogenase gamma subunit